MQVYDDDDCHGGQRSSEVKRYKLGRSTVPTKLDQKTPYCMFKRMMTFMEVKCHQRANMVKYVLCVPILVRIPDAS